MPRIRQNAKDYARNDFRKAIGKAQVEVDLTQKKMLSEVSGIPYSTLWKRLESPENMTLEEFMKLLAVIPIPAEALLTFVGYKTKEIRMIHESVGGEV